MKTVFTGMKIMLFGIGLIVILLFAAVFFLVEKTTEAEKPVDDLTEYGKLSNNNSQEIYLKAFERLRAEYSKVNSVEMDVDVKVTILKKDSNVIGEGQIKYLAKGNKYKYTNHISENLAKEGLMRDLDIIYDGNKFYMFDQESKILSFQKKEDIKIPSAFPNPFFLPIEFFGKDDDDCPSCRLRLQDIKNFLNWSEKAKSISEQKAEVSNGFIHNDIKIQGGKLADIPFDYIVKFVGTSTDTMQPKLITKVKKDGSNLVLIILNNARTVDGINLEIPYSIEVAAYDETGRVNMSAVFSIKNLQINKNLPDNAISPNFENVERIWNSDTKEFVEKNKLNSLN